MSELVHANGSTKIRGKFSDLRSPGGITVRGIIVDELDLVMTERLAPWGPITSPADLRALNPWFDRAYEWMLSASSE